MIAPFQSDQIKTTLVSTEEQYRLVLEWDDGTSLVMGKQAASFAVLMGSGYLSPFTSFMNSADAFMVADSFRTTAGIFCPLPVIHLATEHPEVAAGDLIILKDPNLYNNPVLCTQRVESIEVLSQTQILSLAQAIFGTIDSSHPGVAQFLQQGNVLIAGPVHCFNLSYYTTTFADTFRTASELREEITKRGWNRCVAFQTRNPMHRAHEELCRMAMHDTKADGLIIHMLLGKLKQGDIPAAVRDQAIRAMVEQYFDPQSVIVAGYGFDMLYAGPREALLHALMRQNIGATHFIVGRDHAGVGSYYSPFDAQHIFDTVPNDVYDIDIYRGDTTAWSKKLNKVVMMKDAPDHSPEDFIQLSGTKVREMLKAGTPLPEEYTRPEVATILMRYYQSLA